MFWARPGLDDIDLKITAYAFALRFARFDRADVVDASRLLRWLALVKMRLSPVLCPSHSNGLFGCR